MVVRFAAESVYSGLEVKESVAKVTEYRAISGCEFGSPSVGGPYENCFTLSANNGMGG
jgi:hypothetical protein